MPSGYNNGWMLSRESKLYRIGIKKIYEELTSLIMEAKKIGGVWILYNFRSPRTEGTANVDPGWRTGGEAL